MSSRHPQKSQVASPKIAAGFQRVKFTLPVWTASSSVVAAARFIADRACVVREIWVALSGVPAAAGTFTLTITKMTAAGVTSKVIVTAANMLTIGAGATAAAADTAYKLTLDAETSANELSLLAGDTIKFTQIASSTISGNATAGVLVVFQTTGK